MAIDPLSEFTPARWAAARRILTGEDSKRVSVAAAARAAEVSLPVFRAWIRRSEEKRPEDTPLLHEIAEVIKYRDDYIADTAEDVAWDRAMNGTREKVFYKGEQIDTRTKHHNTLLTTLLKANNRKKYGDKSEVQVNHKIDLNEVYQRFLAGSKMAETLADRGDIIEGTLEPPPMLEAHEEIEPNPVLPPVPAGVDIEVELDL